MPLILPGNVGSATADTGFNVGNSLRVNRADGAFLSKTFDDDGTNHDKGTISVWVKRSEIGAEAMIYSAGASGREFIRFETNDTLTHRSLASSFHLNTTRQFLDVSAWYHIVVAFDSSEGTASNRQKIYVNGVQETSFATETYQPNQNTDHKILSGELQRLGKDSEQGTLANCYFCEVVGIDGVAHSPTSFGEFDEDSGIWKPIDVSGLTFGDNGFHLNFADSSALGADVSGNDNTFANTNLATTDQSIDTCTNNFNTLNQLTKRAGGTLAEGALQYTASGSDSSVYGTMGITPGMKVYFEVKLVSNTAQNSIGIHNEYDRNGAFHKAGNETGGFAFKPRGAASVTQFANNGTVSNHSVNNPANNTILGVAIDNANGQIHYSIAGTFINSSDPTDNNPVALVTGHDVSKTQFLHFSLDTTTTQPINQFNFGSPPYAESGGNSDGNGFGNFNQSVPSGYLALCSKNISSTNS